MPNSSIGPDELPPHIKLFHADGRKLVFLRDQLELRLLGVDELNGLYELRGHTDAQGVPSPGAATEGAADRLVLRPGKLCENSAAFLPADRDRDRRPALDRLTLTVTNLCNLGCSYCYAAKGTYYNTNGMVMTRETVFAALTQAAHAYSRIEHINFFGGEPTLNCDVIEVACEYTRYLYERGDLSHMPTFGITTNGYALSERVLEVLEGYHFSVTLSLDGPREIHDAKRPTKGGKGSYDAVAKTAHTLLAKGLKLEFECTYSKEHLRRDIDMVDLMNFFHSEFGCRILHCQIVSAAPGAPEFIPLQTCLKLQGDAVEASLMNLARGTPKATSLAMRMLHSLTHRTPIWNYCPAGRKDVTINSDGDVYSCFMLMQTAEYGFGSVHVKPPPAAGPSGRGTRGAQKDRIERLLLAQDKYTNSACQRCWAQPLCHGCLGEDLERTGGNIIRSEIPGESEFCDYKRGLVERFFWSVEMAYASSGGTAIDTPIPATPA